MSHTLPLLELSISRQPHFSAKRELSKRDFYIYYQKSLLQGGVDPEKFMAYIRTQIVDDKMYYLLLDEVQMLDCFESVLNGYLRKDNMDEKLKNTFRTVKKSKITSSTIKKYLDYFEDSFLIEAAGRYNIKGKAYIETPKKYYFTDLGLRNARINFRQFEQTHSMENVIYNELRMRGYNVDVGIIPPFCRIPSAVEAQKILP